MADSVDGQDPPRKRAKVEASGDTLTNSSLVLTSLAAPITPPQRKAHLLREPSEPSHQPTVETPQACRTPPAAIPSPFQLTSIRDLPSTLNSDTVTLKDILGDPLISECWEFNYLHDLDMLMEAFDSDVRDMVKVHVVHGFWKQEDGVGLKLQASGYPNVTLHAAYMPEAFGTHHTKMMVLLRHDDLAQVIVHTANMIRRDWANLTQAIWRSPLLPLKSSEARWMQGNPCIGSGLRFKVDFLNYLRAYDSKRTICKPLIEQLNKYDFSEIRGALVASVPGRYSIDSDIETKWGWQALRDVLNHVPVQEGGNPEIVLQISSIATIGQTNQWLEKTLFKSLGTSKSAISPSPSYKIIFPSADEIRRSLDGYESGASIHTKIQTPAQVKQLQYIRPLLNHWAGDDVQHSSNSASQVMRAGRRRAAPHIKTYVRFSNASKSQIDWALVTSANISKQAWGEACNSSGEVRICSYELGVLVWPELYDENAKMVPTFMQNMPMGENLGATDGKVIGFRMPYDLPLVPYSKDDKPWCATAAYNEPDWRGNTWAGFGR